MSGKPCLRRKDRHQLYYGARLRYAQRSLAVGTPTAKQIGIVSALWCKGWIIENNEISYSRCSGVALGKYGDEWDNRAESAEGYVGTLNRADQWLEQGNGRQPYCPQ